MAKKIIKDPGLIEANDLGKWTHIKVRIVKDREAVSDAFARTIADRIIKNNKKGKSSTFIMPVGPTGQYRKLATIINKEKVDISNLYFFNMDEYVGKDGRNLPANHPISFALFVKEDFFDLIDKNRGLKKENFYLPDAQNLGTISEAIEKAGGIALRVSD